MSDVTFGTWSVEASPVTIEYSLVVIEEVRHEVAEGFQKLSRGGIEVGGVLYGLHEGQTVRIMAIRPASCEHASGPAFRPSERDRAALSDQIRQDLGDPRLEGLVCVGWYVSHTRTEISLTESDQEIFSSFFPEPWQVTLVVRPSRAGNMRAGFFVREPGGTVRSSQSYLEFSFPDRLAAVFDHHRSENRGSENRGDHRSEHRASYTERERPVSEYRRAPRMVNPIPLPVQETRPAPPEPAPVLVTARPSSSIPSLFDEAPPVPKSQGIAKKWVWVGAALIAITAGTVAGARFLGAGQTNPGLALNVLERQGQLDIEWNRQASPVSKAIRGALEIADGAQTRTVPLTSGDLALGKFFYKRGTGDVQVRMIVEEPGGNKVQEASRFLGPPPTQGNEEELKALQQRRSELEAEIARLKKSNDEQAQRIQQLERTLKILQTRPGVN